MEPDGYYDTEETTEELETILNRYSKENGSNTPDFILAEYLLDCIANFDTAVKKREKWYGRFEKFVDNGTAVATNQPTKDKE